MSDVLVLCYHAVSARWPSPLAVSPRQLDRQVARVLRRGYVPATFTRAVLDPPAPRTVAVTFDDAFASVLRNGLPVLRRLGVPGTVFAVSGFADLEESLCWPGIEQWRRGPWARELRSLGWDELRELARGGWEVGSHTVSHPRLTRLDDAALAAELRRSREACERELGSCTSIAYPYGDVDDRVVAAARDAGYAAAAALPARPHAAEALRWPRVGVYRRDEEWRFAAKAARPVRVVRALLPVGP